MEQIENRLIDEFNPNEVNINRKKKIYRIALFLFLFLIIIGVTIFVIIHFALDKEKTDIEIDNDDPYNLDTISEEELNLARNSFRQDNFSDSKDPTNFLQYNIFIPENYTENKRYPLIIFLGDETTIGKETNISLFKSVGGPIWATNMIQKKHKCFILIPQYNEKIINEYSRYPKEKIINTTMNLISSIINKYNIDNNRIYITGQSMGASTTLFLLSKYQDFFTASLIIESNLIFEELLHLIKTPFTYLTTSGSEKALDIENIIIKYFNDSNISYGLLNDVNINEKIETLNYNVNKIYKLGYKNNFINYKKNSTKNNNNNFKYFKNGYKIEAVLDWLLSQNKKKCKDGFYYSDENGDCILIIPENIKKKVFLITNHGSGDLLEKLLKQIPFISEVRTGSPEIISEMTESFLSLFDCIIYDLQDTGFLVKIKDIKVVERYINNGGSFLVTHDNWELYEQYSDGLYLLGMKFNESNNMWDILENKPVNKTRINHPDHPLFSSYFDLSNWGIINILPSHSNNHFIEGNIDEKMLIEFILDKESSYRFDYLSANEFGRGRIIYWAAGHCNYLSEDEKILFNNIVSWLMKIKN